MPGNGTIGGGRSCWMNFRVQDNHGVQRWAAFDEDAPQNCQITVEFPGLPGQNPVTVPLKDGPCVVIKWR